MSRGIVTNPPVLSESHAITWLSKRPRTGRTGVNWDLPIALSPVCVTLNLPLNPMARRPELDGVAALTVIPRHPGRRALDHVQTSETAR
jgi:hypothetical protein